MLDKECTWNDVKAAASSKLKSSGLPDIYKQRLRFEISEIEKQGSNAYWLDLVHADSRFDNNPNHLVLPWLLGMVEADPIATRIDQVITTSNYAKVIEFLNSNGKLPPEIFRDPDNPDIDIDCLPEARDPIKDYATRKYGSHINDGYGAVCSVGTWMTYLLRSAIKDVAKALAACDSREVDLMTKELPDEVDDVKDNGESPCKGCKKVHKEAKCPACGSPDTENPTIGRLLEEHVLLRQFNERYPEVVDCAVRLVGRIRAMGKHAGALIIADRPLFGNIPMSLDTNTKQWKSLWTEGRNTQLSKFGYTKWDILGLKNLRYIYEASRMIEENHGISFGTRTTTDYKFTPGHKVTIPSMSGWDDINPETRCGGHYFTRDGEKVIIDMDDPLVLHLASEAQTDAVFQFDTDLAKRILSNGVYNFNDLMIFNAMGHPGPMAMIPDYVKRRNGEDTEWRQLDDPRVTEILGETFNTIVYQEQLQTMWQRLGGFTAPEAQEARKAVAKKWKDKLKPIEERWISGAGKVLGHASAVAWWEKMVSFGRYAFNRSHSASYCMVAFRCLWLKGYFPQEWWASVMSYCNADKLVRYMNVARSEGVIFVPMDINNLHLNLAAVPETPRIRHTDPPNGHVMPGLICLKGIGSKVAAAVTGEVLVEAEEDVKPEQETADGEEQASDLVCLTGTGSEVVVALEGNTECTLNSIDDLVVEKTGPIESVDDFVDRKGKNKLLLERFIKLGSFKTLPGHECSLAVWVYYQCKYCSGSEITALKNEIRAKILALQNWNDETINEARERQAQEFKKIYPKRKVPKKITDWTPKPEITLENVAKLYTVDFTLDEILKFEEQYLGYHLHSPLDLYETKGERSVKMAKKLGELEAVISEVFHTKTRTQMPMCKLSVTDGIQTASLIIWSDELMSIDKAMLRVGRGIRAKVNWDPARKNFTLQSRTQMIRLKRREDSAT